MFHQKTQTKYKMHPYAPPPVPPKADLFLHRFVASILSNFWSNLASNPPIGIQNGTRDHPSNFPRSIFQPFRNLPRSARICQESARICQESAIASTHLPHIHWPRNASQVTNCQAPKRWGGGDRPLAAFNEYIYIYIYIYTNDFTY